MVPFLGRQHAVTVLPDVRSLASLRAVPTSRVSRRPFVGFGDPYFNLQQAAEAKQKQKPSRMTLVARNAEFNVRGFPVHLRRAPRLWNLDSAELAKLPRLPETAAEIRSIASVLNADPIEDIFIGERATEDAVKSVNLAGYKVVYFATHGLVPGDLDGLRQPALALTTPKLGNTKEDGVLTLGEVLGLRLNADWVVLSACSTGAANGAGAEAFSGLGQAFFYAGTRAILLTHWPVETTSAMRLTTNLFARQAADAALSRAQALRLARVSLIDGKGFVDDVSGKTVFSYAHPIFWAPFTLVGDGGADKPAS